MRYPTEDQELPKGIVLWSRGTFPKPGSGRQFVYVRCNRCGDERPVSTADTRRQSGICAPCHRKEQYATLNNRRGPQSTRYKGPERIASQGYVDVALFPGDDFYASMGRNGRGQGYVRYVQKHRLIMARHLGRPLEQWEHVHHLDGNKLNNDIGNLEIVDNKTHAVITALMRENNALKKELSALQKEIEELRALREPLSPHMP